MKYVEFDSKMFQSFEYETTVQSQSDGSILGICELGKASIQLINEENNYSSYKGSWIKTIHGSFYIYDVTPVQEKINIKLDCYDIKYKLDIPYDSSKHTFPCTLKEWRNSIFNVCDVAYDDSDFPNCNLILEKEPYVGDNPSNRTVISIIAQAGASIVITDELDCFYFDWFSNTVHTANDWSSLTTEKECSLPINCVVLGRGDVEDNVFYPTTKPTNSIEFRIDNNYILDPQDTTTNDDKRYETIVPIYDRLNGFNCLIFNMISKLIPNKLSIKLGQKIKYTDIWGNELVASIMTKKINWLGGDLENDDNYEITLSAKEIKETSTDLSYASSIPNDILRVERKADKNTGKIEDLVSEVTENTEKTNKLEMTVDETKQTISKVETTVEDMITTTQTSEGGNHLYLEKALEQDALEYHIKGKSEQENSPTPDYPSEIKSIAKEGTIELKITGKNLLNAPYNEDNKLTRTATSNDDYKSTDFYAELKAGKQYTFSCKTDGTFGIGNDYQTECYLLLDKKYDYILSMRNNEKYTFTVNQSGKYYLRTDVNFKDETHSFWNFQIEEGEEATPFEEYKEREVLIDLNKYNEEGNIVGNYELSSLSDEIRNDLDIVDGQTVLTQNVEKIILDGSESWILNGNQFAISGIGYKTNADGAVWANTHFSQISSVDKNLWIGNSAFIVIRYDEFTTVDELKTWLGKNPVTVYYELAESRQIILSNVQIPLFEGTNHINLVDDVETNTSIKFLCETPFSGEYATRQEVKTTKNDLQTEIKQTADGIKSEVSATYTTKTEVLEAKQGAIDSANSNTAEKLKEYSTTTEMNAAIEQRVSEESVSISLEVSKKVNEDDFTGANIILAINNDDSEAQIAADKIGLIANDILNIIAGNELNLTGRNISIAADNFSVDKDGNADIQSGIIGGFNLSNRNLSSNITPKVDYTEDDINLLIKFLAGQITLTQEQINRLDANGDGNLNSADLVVMRQTMNSNTASYKPGTFILNTNDSIRTLCFFDGDNNLKTMLGLTGIQTPNINADTLSASGDISASGVITAGGNRCITSPYVHWLNFVNTGSSNYMEVNLYNPFAGISSFGVNVWASDKRLKRNIIDSKYNALEIIKQIKHREFDYKSGGHVKLGYIADELEKLDKDLIFEVGEDKIKQPSVDKIIPLLSKAIQEQQSIIENLLERIEKLENKKGE